MYPNIEAERARKGLTIEALASILEISPRTYQNWQKGKGAIPSTALIKLARLFSAEMEYLLEERE